MPKLQQLIPDTETLLALAPEELAPALLRAIVASIQNGQFHPSHIVNHEYLFGHFRGNPSGQQYYEPRNQGEVERAIGEAWQWLEVNGLIMPNPGGSNGWMILTRRGDEMLNHPDRFPSYIAAAQFSKALLHPSIREPVWLELARGDYDSAVFKAFKAVEEAVRTAGNFGDDQFGVDLMRKAFGPPDGPLVTGNTSGEKKSTMDLLQGQLASSKIRNPIERSGSVTRWPLSKWLRSPLTFLSIVDGTHSS